MKTNPNDPIHPSVDETTTRLIGNNDSVTEFMGANGLTKREYFAAMAMQGMLSNSYNDGASQPLSTASHDQIAQMAVSIADALIAEMNKPTEQEG